MSERIKDALCHLFEVLVQVACLVLENIGDAF